jgi:formate hydrogenlyase subunit 4
MTKVFLSLLQLLLVVLLAPSVSWFIKKMKATSQNRVGPTLLQVYFDLLKLFQKGMVVSETASWIFHAMPFVLFGATLVVAAMTPVIWPISLLGFMGDAILFVYLLALGRFFLALAALDTGTTFGGMGSSREMALSSLAEPALLLSFFALGYRTHTLSLEGMISRLALESPEQLLFFTSLAFGSLLIVTLAESGRIPVDNPATHLELTMIHEAMILEYSGKYLALIEWGHQIKQLVFFTLLANLFFPWGMMGHVFGLTGWGASLVLYLFKVFFLAFIIGWIEIHSAKLRLFRVPDLLTIAFVLSILSLLSQLMIGRSTWIQVLFLPSFISLA